MPEKKLGRVRLTIWYCCALILVALVLAGASRWAMAVSLDHALDQSLRYRLIRPHGFIDENSRQGLEQLTTKLGGLEHLGQLFQVFGPCSASTLDSRASHCGRQRGG